MIQQQAQRRKVKDTTKPADKDKCLHNCRMCTTGLTRIPFDITNDVWTWGLCTDTVSETLSIVLYKPYRKLDSAHYDVTGHEVKWYKQSSGRGRWLKVLRS